MRPLSLAHLPTPLEFAPHLSDLLGLKVWIKRDDLTGSHLSGNKLRKLGYLLAEAKAQGATHVLTCGGLQSNHCRATALAARQVGLTPVLLLRTPDGEATVLEALSGNVLLNAIAGATIHTCTPETYRHHRDARLSELASVLKQQGHHPYVIPEGGSNALGSLGYRDAAREILTQLAAQGEGAPDAIVTATGSGGTQAGLAIGLAEAEVPTLSLGIAVCDDEAYFMAKITQICQEALRLGLTSRDALAQVRVLDHAVGRGYGLTTPEELRTLLEVAQRDGLVLDPVYSNKAMHGLLQAFRTMPERLSWRDAPPESIVFVHTGGVFGLMGHAFSAEERALLLPSFEPL